MIATIVVCTVIILAHQQYLHWRTNVKIDDVLKEIDAETTAIATEQVKLGTRVENLVKSIVHENELVLTPEQETEFNDISARQKLISDSLSKMAADPVQPVPAPIDVAPPVEPVVTTETES